MKHDLRKKAKHLFELVTILLMNTDPSSEDVHVS